MQNVLKEGEEINKIRIFTRVITSIIIGLSIAAMLVSKSFNLKCFYDVGEVTDVYGSMLTMESMGVGYENDDDNHFTLLTDYAIKILPGSSGSWAEIDIYVDSLNVPQLEWILVGCDESGKSTFSKVERIKEGHNYIKTDGMIFQNLKILIWDQKGAEFLLKSVQFKEREHRTNFVEFCFYAAIIAVSCYIIMLFVNKKYRKKMYEKIGAISIGYQNILVFIYEKVRPMCCFKERTRRIGRIACFSFVLLYMVFMWNIGKYVSWYKQTSIIMGICIFIIFLFSVESVEKETNLRKWDQEIFQCWFFLMIWFCISDFIVSKMYCFTGYVFLLFMGLMLYAWSRMKEPELLFSDIICAVRITFFLMILYCIFCRPIKSGYRYNGPFFAPNVFASHLVLVIACEISVMINMLSRKWNWKKSIFFAMELGVTLFFLWKAQARGPILAMGILVLIAVYYLVIKRKKVKQTVIFFLLIGICILPSWMVMEKILTVLPGVCGTEIEYQTEENLVKESTDWNGKNVVYAAQSELRVFRKFRNLDEFSSGRIVIWKKYLKNMNLVGHSGNVKVGDKRQVAHNLFLEIAYRYGVVALPCYIALWLLASQRAINCMKKYKNYSALPLTVFLGFLILSMNDTAERPWVLGLWFFAYFLMLFCMLDVDKQEKEIIT
ncbi:MAG: hypothetical protein HFI37_09215 [Lachnospiraceae bacterium]|nr:hypothetical protein [Lachnospiraceae bacterium]